MKVIPQPTRIDGYAPLGDYAALGEGRSVAMVAADGAIDWWCVPNLNSPPLFDRLLDAPNGGYFAVTPVGEYRTERRYRPDSNVLETLFITQNGSVRLTESINSNLAGRLPWCELARRIEGISGEVELAIVFKPGTRAETVSPWLQDTVMGRIYHVGSLMIKLRHSKDITDKTYTDCRLDARLVTHKGSRSLIALLATENEPLTLPPLDEIDERIDISDYAWREWAKRIHHQGPYAREVVRSALSLKFLLYSPSGAIAAAATTSLPEGLRSGKNWDYRYAWVRDACLVIKAFIDVGALEECKAAFSWLTSTILRHNNELCSCFTLEGGTVPAETELPLQGYRGSQPVRVGNNARSQLQLGMYGDMLGTALLFVEAGHVIDLATARMLSELANQCADRWRRKDSGIWELYDEQFYTHSRMYCWLALNQAVQLAEKGHIERTWMQRWSCERDHIRDWIEKNCWSETLQAYTFYPGTHKLDAAITLCHHYGRDVNPERMRKTLQRIRDELSHECGLLYRYSGVEKEEGAFIACAFWMVEAMVALDEREAADKLMRLILKQLDGSRHIEPFNEMYDVRENEWRGNYPQGLSHLSLICAARALAGDEREKSDY